MTSPTVPILSAERLSTPQARAFLRLAREEAPALAHVADDRLVAIGAALVLADERGELEHAIADGETFGFAAADVVTLAAAAYATLAYGLTPPVREPSASERANGATVRRVVP